MVAHPKEPAVAEDVDHAVDVGFAGEVEACTHVSAWSDDCVPGQPRVQPVVDVRALVGQDVVQVRLDLTQEWVTDQLSHSQLLFFSHPVLLSQV